MYKLLIVDDSDTQIECAISFVDWKALGVTEIKTATNGKNALDIYETFKPDIILSDVVMPVMDGLELLSQIRKKDNETEFVFMSCYEDFEYVKTAIDNNVSSYILKPLMPKTLSDTAEKTVERIKEKKTRSQNDKMLRESLSLLKKSFLYQILYSTHIDKNSLDEITTTLNFDEYKSFAVIEIKLLNNEYDSTHIYSLLQVTKLYFDELFNCDAIIKNANQIIMLTMDKTNVSEQFLENVAAHLRKFLDYVKSEYNFNIAVGISNIFDSPEKAQAMMNQAATAIENNSTCEAGGIYFYEDYDYATFNLDLTEIKNDISFLIENPSVAFVDEFLAKYYPKNMRLTKTNANTLCFSIVTSLNLLLLEQNISFSDIFGSSNAIWTKLECFDSIFDTHQWLKNILNMCCEFIIENKKIRSNKIISAIINNINKNFRTLGSVDDIVSDLYISAGYARNLFKAQMGKTISEYLTERRIESAKTLLADRDIKIYEVAELVGYKSKAHFAENFKRYTGLTPKDYQLRYNGGKQ